MMCGRFMQYQGMSDYLEVLAPDRIVVSGHDTQPIGHNREVFQATLTQRPGSGHG